MRRKITFCGIAIGLVGLLIFWFWPQPKFNLLVITLDTTRADRLGCYGYSGAKTPVLDSLAASGVLCNRAYTVAPLTLPAHASLFTGLYPAENGIRSNGRGRLHKSIPTLAERLEQSGFATAAFTASFVLDRKFGLNRGFQIYDDEIAESEVTTDADHHHRERDGKIVVDAALDWLKRERTSPFFCWVHLYDPHAPYLPHQDLFSDQFVDRPYDAEIAYVDQQVGRLVDFLKERGLESNTLIVVVGDHGEGLGEHLENKHGMTLYNSTMRVPLIFRQQGKLVPGQKITGPFSMVDVSPTILGLLGISDPRKITGKNFASSLKGGTATASLCYGATDEPFLNNGWSPLRSLIDGNWKYIHTTQPELYDLQADPNELQNLADADPAKMAEMESRLAELESKLVLRADATVQLRPDERRALQSLGYLGGGVSNHEGANSQHLPDIKEMLPLDAAVDEASQLAIAGQFDDAIDRLQVVIAKSPSHSKANCFLADLLRHQKQFDQAKEVLGRLLKIKPDAAEAHYGLGLVNVEQGLDDEAASEFSRTLALDPDYAEAHYDLAMIYVRQKKTKEALSHFQSVLDIDHCHGAAYSERATLLVTLGRSQEAIPDYIKALKYSPNSASLHFNFGIVLAGKGDARRALDQIERAVELSPQNAEFQYILGSFLINFRKYDEAVEHLSAALKLQPDHLRAKSSLDEVRKLMDAQVR